MAYTVRKLLESEQFPKMKLLCGEKGLDLEVKGIRIIEIEDMERYLTGGEILITSLQVYLSCSDREVEQHFEDLVKSEISGFIVKKRKEYDPTGRRLSLLEKHCKKYEIPLVEILGDFDYWGIIRHVMIQVFDKDTARLKYFKITHDSFNSFILKNNGSSNTASIREVYEKVRKTESYEEFISQYVKRYVYASDKKMVHDFLSSEGLEERLVDGCIEKDLPYRRITGKDKNVYVWMEAKKYIDANENTAIITLHNEKIVQNTVIKMERELIKKEQDMAKQYWDMVSLLTTVLNHNQIVESGYQDDISFYTKQVYLQLQKNYPEYGITDEEIASVAHLAPIHDIGKIKVPIEILNKNGKLTDEEMNVVKQHPLVGAAMTRRFPEGVITEKLNQYSYEICRHHHERYDGSGYPDGLKGNAIPMCAQVVGIVDAYDALINDRPYKRKYEPEEAIRMISNGECGAFSKKLIQCLTAAAKQPEWLKVTKSQA